MAVFVGLILGLVLGSIPVSIPGISLPVKLGLAGGPIVIGILIGTFGPRLHMITYTTYSANLMLRALGLSMYLACLGLEAGAHSDFHAVRSACENSWLNLRYSPQNLLGESIPEIQENVRSQFSSASFEKRNDFTSMSCVGIDVNTPDQNVIAFCRAIQDIP